MPHPCHEQPFAHFDLALADVHHYPLITPYPVSKANAVEPAGRPQQRLMFLPTRQAADHFQLGEGRAGQTSRQVRCQRGKRI